jgi:membrane protease YdiL (CAAX protease family)
MNPFRDPVMNPAIHPDSPRPPRFWRTVRILLAASRARSTGRRRRAQQLLQQRSGNSTNWGGFGTFFAALIMVGLNVLAAFLVHEASQPPAPPTPPAPVYSSRTIPVSQTFLDAANRALKDRANFFVPAEKAVPEEAYSVESQRIAEITGRDPEEIESTLRQGLHDRGIQAFTVDATPPPEAAATVVPTAAEVLAPMLGSVLLLLWAVMLIFQGEGLEVDLQRRRHPMWEWLFSHPVPPGAVFLAEILSPLAANPIYWGAPLFVGFSYGFVYGPGLGALATVLMGVPIAIATACIGKAVEIAVMLRVAPRSRGAVVGLMGWLGYTAMMVFFFGLSALPKLTAAAPKFLLSFAALPWPYLRWFLGGTADGDYSFSLGLLICWDLAAGSTAAAVAFSVWGAQQGLAGNFASDSRPSAAGSSAFRSGTRPLYRKELLWFLRDRSAIVQTILVPVTLAGFQAFNLRFLVGHAQESWNYLSGAAILFGTYFLWVLGPKSLTSEGNALWIAMSWPQGLEALLKAKAWLWSLISSVLVALILCYAVFLFPSAFWKIALVGIGWFLFSRSMAEKSVTLVTVTSDSGEVEKIPAGRRWAVQLGMLTFSIGIVTQQWHIAVMGIVYSYITAAAIWQNFRARLPFLYDPWSEELPPPPTLMHAMIAISILVESGAVVAGILLGIFGRENLAIAQAMGYGICSAVVAFGTVNFLDNRGVSLHEVINWRPSQALPRNSNSADAPWWRNLISTNTALVPALLAGVAGGLLLGVFAHGYIAVLHHIPATAEILRKSEEEMSRVFGLKQSYFVMAVFFAPFAEEYLFRGLLFRALDREWGGWRAVLGSAAFFAIYHGPLSWLPVGLLGVANALLFKKTGRLAPAVVLHMVYNAVVLS